MILAETWVRWDWVTGHLGDIGRRTMEHLVLTGLAIGIGLVLSLAFAVLALRVPRAYGPIAGVAGILYTIPSLAAFALMVPFTGISVTTAEVALVSYTILILVRNIVTGVSGVPEEVREAATGMGYRPVRRFWEMDLPLALPAIIAGLRLATVTVVGLVTVTSLLGLGGLGYFILDGFRRSIVFPTEIIVGTVLSVVLAALLDLGFVLTERVLTPWNRKRAA